MAIRLLACSHLMAIAPALSARRDVQLYPIKRLYIMAIETSFEEFLKAMNSRKPLSEF